MTNTSSNNMTFGERLAYTRKEKGLSQRRLGKLIGVNNALVCHWEQDKLNPDVYKIQKIIKALKVSEDWFENDDNFTENQQDINITFGQRLAHARDKKELNQKQFAELIGVCRSRVCNWEKGRNKPDMSMIRKIVKALEVSEDWLIGNDNFSIKPTGIHQHREITMLTKEQQQLVADNEWMISYMYHKLFGYYRSTDYEDYYGYAAIGLCKAAKRYGENDRSFFSFAYHQIRSEMGHAYENINKDLQPLISLDNPLSDESGADKLESIIQAPDEWEPLEYKILAESVYQKVEHVLTPSQREVFKPWLHKMELDEIAQEAGISYQSVILRIRQARDKCKTYYRPDELFTYGGQY
jgi:RNA polymerase sigma factor (sigma-70 family)